MTYIPGQSKTKVVAEGNRFQARYYDPAMKLWFDLGDPRDTEAEARALIRQFEEDA